MNRRFTVLLPAIFVTYSLAYLDRANFGFGAAAGMAADLKISPAESSLLGSLFFLGYFLFQIPGVLYAQRYSVKRVIFVGLIGWGLLASATGLITDIRLLYIDRFLLGVLESAVMPALLVLQTRWYSKPERARANAILLLGNPITLLWMSLMSGWLVTHTGWRGMFIIEGLPPIFWAFVWWRLVSDHPREASWLPAESRSALEDSLAQEQRAIAPVANYAAAFKSPRILVLAAVHFFWSIGVYGFVIWLPTMIKTADMGMTELGLLAAAPYLAAAIAEVSASTWSDLTGRRMEVLWPCMLVAAAAFYGSYLLGASHFWVGFVLLVIAGAAMYAPYGPFFAYIADTTPSNVAAGAIGLINSMGALGSFVGAYGVGLLNGATGSPGASYLMMAAGLVVTAVLALRIPKLAKA